VVELVVTEETETVEGMLQQEAFLVVAEAVREIKIWHLMPLF
jgi:hypothetical protein